MTEFTRGERVLHSLSQRIQDLDYQIENENNQPNSFNRRFETINEDDLKELLFSTRNKNTEKKTNSDVLLFQNWLVHEKKDCRQPLQIAPSELDNLISLFLVSVKKIDKKTGMTCEYEPESLTSKFNSIARYLRENNYTHEITTDHLFRHSRDVLCAKKKSLKAAGLGGKPNKSDCITDEEIEQLRIAGQLGVQNPNSLLNTLWLMFTLHFGLRGVQEHVQMLWGDVTLKTTTTGEEFLEFNERITKTRQGTSRDVRAFPPKVFACPDMPLCPIGVYKEYRKRRPVEMLTDDARMYLQPVRGLLSEKNSPDKWYRCQPLGKNSLSTLCKRMFSAAGISGRHTNHSARRTSITALLENDVHETKVQQLSGHKNVQSLNSYRTVSLRQQQQMSTLLTGFVNGHPHESETAREERSSRSPSHPHEFEQFREERNRSRSHSPIVQQQSLPLSQTQNIINSTRNIAMNISPRNPNPCHLFSNCVFNGNVQIVMGSGLSQK